LNEASTAIWAEKHDRDGKQLNAQAFGKNVYAKDSLLQRVSDPNLSGGEAKRIVADYRKMLVTKKRLREDDLSSAERAKLEGEYNGLLNQYFEVRE
jgi:ABC-type iron transport system FetAB ATPase subunit